MIRQADVKHVGDGVLLAEPFCDLKRRRGLTFDADTEGFDAAEHEPRIRRPEIRSLGLNEKLAVLCGRGIRVADDEESRDTVIMSQRNFVPL